MFFLDKAHLALTLETPLFEQLLTLLVVLQARYIAKLELSVGRDIGLGSKDHHITNVGPAYEWIAAVIDKSSVYPNADRTRFFVFEIIWGVAALPVEFVGKARESERVVDDSILNESTVEGNVSQLITTA